MAMDGDLVPRLKSFFQCSNDAVELLQGPCSKVGDGVVVGRQPVVAEDGFEVLTASGMSFFPRQQGEHAVDAEVHPCIEDVTLTVVPFGMGQTTPEENASILKEVLRYLTPVAHAPFLE